MNAGQSDFKDFLVRRPKGQAVVFSMFHVPSGIAGDTWHRYEKSAFRAQFLVFLIPVFRQHELTESPVLEPSGAVDDPGKRPARYAGRF